MSQTRDSKTVGSRFLPLRSSFGPVTSHRASFLTMYQPCINPSFRPGPPALGFSPPASAKVLTVCAKVLTPLNLNKIHHLQP